MGKGQRKIEVKSNITDNESAKMTTSKGTIQGYNGVATVDKKTPDRGGCPGLWRGSGTPYPATCD